jgi:hypothetical protein
MFNDSKFGDRPRWMPPVFQPFSQAAVRRYLLLKLTCPLIFDHGKIDDLSCKLFPIYPSVRLL